MVKVVYIAHEVRGDVQGNIRKILNICRRLHTKDVIPIAPYLVALQYLNDNSLEERALGIGSNAEYFRRGFIDEVCVFGSRVSTGIFGEIMLALQFGIPITVGDERAGADVSYAIPAIKSGITLAKYLVAERRLDNGNTLLFREDGRDIVAVESHAVIDPSTGRDVSRFVPNIVSWDEIINGRVIIERKGKEMPAPEKRQFIEGIYTFMARAYSKGKPLESVF